MNSLHLRRITGHSALFSTAPLLPVKNARVFLVSLLVLLWCRLDLLFHALPCVPVRAKRQAKKNLSLCVSSIMRRHSNTVRSPAQSHSIVFEGRRSHRPLSPPGEVAGSRDA